MLGLPVLSNKPEAGYAGHCAVTGVTVLPTCWEPQGGCSTSTALSVQGPGLDTCFWYKAPFCQLPAWTAGSAHKGYHGLPSCCGGRGMGIEIKDCELSAFHSNSQAKTLETCDRH